MNLKSRRSFVHHYENHKAMFLTHLVKAPPHLRVGIRDGASPFQKVSFETCTEFLRRAAFYNEQDQLKSPSSSIVLGKLGSFGTGACEIRQPIVI